MEVAVLVILALAIPVCAVAGFFMALGQRRQSREFALQLVAFDRRLRAFEGRFGAAPEPAPVPEAPFVTQTQPPPAPEEPAQDVSQPDAPIEPASAELPPLDEPAPAPAPASPGAVSPAPGFEETLGTRWAVWVGGVALALGGIFLVRYSIEQGLFGPTARVAMGVLFSLALLAAGEWMRRRDVGGASLGAIPQTHVPAVLTAAGTSTAFATIYAAYALYGMLSPAVAFVLLGAVSVLTMLGSALHGPALAAHGLVAAVGSTHRLETAKPKLWGHVLYHALVVV